MELAKNELEAGGSKLEVIPAGFRVVYIHR